MPNLRKTGFSPSSARWPCSPRELGQKLTLGALRLGKAIECQLQRRSHNKHRPVGRKRGPRLLFAWDVWRYLRDGFPRLQRVDNEMLTLDRVLQCESLAVLRHARVRETSLDRQSLNQIPFNIHNYRTLAPRFKDQMISKKLWSSTAFCVVDCVSSSCVRVAVR